MSKAFTLRLGPDQTRTDILEHVRQTSAQN